MNKILHILVLVAILLQSELLKANDVLPGDCNKNGVVELVDFLFCGLASGNTGAMRVSATTDCSLENAVDWDVEINGVNGKHQDADGNGIVDLSDLDIVAGNYGCTIGNFEPPLLNPNNGLFGIVERTLTVDGETAHIFDIYITNIEEVNGLAFSFDYGNISYGIDEDAIEVDTTGTWLQTSEMVILHDKNQDKMDIVFAGGQPILPSQNQPVCKIIVMEDFIGRNPFLLLNISLINGVSLDSQGRPTSFQNFNYIKKNLVHNIQGIKKNLHNINSSATNSFEKLNIRLANSASEQLAHLIISSIQGRLLIKTQVLLQLGENTLEVDVSNLKAGLYVFNLVSEDKQFYSNKFAVEQKYRY